MANPTITQYFKDYLNREPDAPGLAFWEAQLANGTTLEQIRLAIARSPESMQRAEASITALYRSMFGREPDAAGLAHWVGAVRKGEMTVPDVKNRFLNSQEYRDYQKRKNTETKTDTATDNTGVDLTDLGTGGDQGGTDDATGGTGGGDTQTGGAGSAEDIAASARNARDTMFATFTWLEELGLGDKIYQWAVEGKPAEAIVALIRQETAYKNLFAGIRDERGQMRMNEASYIARMREYKDVLGDFGMYNENYDTNTELAAFLASDVDPNELRDRLTIYDHVSNNSDVLDAFYVYAGMSVTGEELYQAVVDPNYAQSLSDEYNIRATSTKLDYDTWITRATEVGLNRLATQLTQLEASGAQTADALAQIRSMDPDIAKDFMQMLHVGTVAGSDTLDLASLQRAFQNALLGSAAVSHGLDIPTADRIEELRSAGLTQAAAIKGYGEYAKDKNLLNAMAQRAGTQFSQDIFEEGAFLSQAGATRQMEKAAGQEEALSRGRSGGSFGMQGGRLMQQGLRVR